MTYRPERYQEMKLFTLESYFSIENVILHLKYMEKNVIEIILGF